RAGAHGQAHARASFGSAATDQFPPVWPGSESRGSKRRPRLGCQYPLRTAALAHTGSGARWPNPRTGSLMRRMAEGELAAEAGGIPATDAEPSLNKQEPRGTKPGKARTESEAAQI